MSSIKPTRRIKNYYNDYRYKRYLRDPVKKGHNVSFEGIKDSITHRYYQKYPSSNLHQKQYLKMRHYSNQQEKRYATFFINLIFIVLLLLSLLFGGLFFYNIIMYKHEKTDNSRRSKLKKYAWAYSGLSLIFIVLTIRFTILFF